MEAFICAVFPPLRGISEGLDGSLFVEGLDLIRAIPCLCTVVILRVLPMLYEQAMAWLPRAIDSL